MRRKIGFLITGSGLLVLAWLAITVWRGDPITSLYTRYKQDELASRLSTVERSWSATTSARPTLAGRRAAVRARPIPVKLLLAREAAAFERSLVDGAPIGRIVIPRLHLGMIVVQGTSESDLTTGPGHYDAASGQSTALPGMGGVIGVAGHRTTFLHPFRYINDLKAGDNIYLVMPYGTFRYVVFRHEVVSSTDWSILSKQPFEELVLSACHPLYSASHRWVVFARLTHAPQRVKS